jgi:predicted amidophosphoribosyltransferase
MEEEGSKKDLNTFICTECKADLPNGTKFCTECGKPVETAPNVGESEETKTCPSCGAEVKSGTNFCIECGREIGETAATGSKSTETNMGAAETNMGAAEIDIETAETTPETSNQITTCPKCFANLKPGNKFCIQCGVNVQEYQAAESEVKSKRKKSSVDDTIDELAKTGEGLLKDAEKMGDSLLKGVGGFLNKSTSKSTSKKRIKPQKKGQRFLVCDSCGGYYHLQPEEEPEDFDDTCECGDKLRVSDTKT